MTPKEKADSLVDLFRNIMPIDESGCSLDYAKDLSIASVYELIDWSKQWIDEEMLTPVIIYLEKVKEEINKL